MQNITNQNPPANVKLPQTIVWVKTYNSNNNDNNNIQIIYTSDSYF